MSSAFESELWEMVDLGEHIEGKIGLPEANFIALVEENFPEPCLYVGEIETAYGVCYQPVFVNQRDFIQVDRRRDERIFFLLDLLCLRNHLSECTCNKTVLVESNGGEGE